MWRSATKSATKPISPPATTSLHWKKLGLILPISTNGLDAWQADGGVALADYALGRLARAGKIRRQILALLHRRREAGYEARSPLHQPGLDRTTPAAANTWQRGTKSRSYHPHQSDARRALKKDSLQKPDHPRSHPNRSAGPFVMFYNGKLKNGFERIGMAVSRDLVNWTRYKANRSVVANGEAKTNGISGDPQLVKNRRRLGDVFISAPAGNRRCSTRLPAPTIWFTGPNGPG